MGMVVRTNVPAMNAQRQLGINSNNVSKSLEKLSSGFRINRAADDASGLAISEKMKAQIKGLETASANSQDGISLIQTAEGGAQEIHDMLNRMTELATKSANGTIQNEVDREAIQREVDDLNAEITRISKSTNFNGINLLDGNLSGGASGSGALNGGINSTFKNATTGEIAGGNMSEFGDFDRKETINVDGVDIEVDWTKLDDKQQAALTKNWSGGSISTQEATDAAKILQDTINSAIDATNKNRGTAVDHIEIKGAQSNGNATFKITSGMSGNKDSGISIDSKSANGVLGAMVTGYKKFSGGTPDTTGTKTISTLTGVDFTDLSKGIDDAARTALKTAFASEVAIDGDLKIDLSKVDWSKASTSGDVKDVIMKAVDAAAAKLNKTNAAGEANYTKYSDVKFGTAADGSIKIDFTKTAMTVNDIDTQAAGTKATFTSAVVADTTNAVTDATKEKLEIDGKVYELTADELTALGASNNKVNDVMNALIAKYNSDDSSKFTISRASSTATSLTFTAKDAKTNTGAPVVKYTSGTASSTGTIGGKKDGTAGTVANGTAGVSSAAIKTVAQDKFSGDIGDVNGVNFDMVLGGEKFNIAVEGISDQANQGANNAKAIKTAIDATLDKYIAAKGMNEEEGNALKSNITVEFTKDGRFSVTNNTGKTLSFEDKDGGKAADVLGIGGASGKVVSGGLTLQIGDTGDDFNKVTVSVDDLSAKGIGTEGINVGDQDAANASLDKIKSAINKVSTNRANLGSLQNRLEHTINNLDTTAENMTSANSRIRDTDMAKEMMNYTKMNVLTQAAQAMLAQANQQPQSILQLLQ